MSNAAVIVNKVLRMRSALLREGNRLCAALSYTFAEVRPHVISGKGNGKRY